MPESLSASTNFVRFTHPMPNHRKWEPSQPWLYQAQLTLCNEKGTIVDRAKKQFGMRSFSLDENSKPKGRMYLNEKEIRLRGANTMGHLQQCVFKKDWAQLRDDILLAKICNMNFFRLTQRPVQPEIYDYCDRLGMMTQTDLPLFGKFRPNTFCEAIRQTEEMERLVRSHPCNIMVSYINEPSPATQKGFEHRDIARIDLERFFRAANETVHFVNPDRVIKHVDGDYNPPTDGLPDNHYYAGWYNNHGMPCSLGKLHKGYWQSVKPGWMYGCGEFGAEGLEDEKIMRTYYPKSWLPQSPAADKKWSPKRIVGSQTQNMHFFFFDTQSSLKDWIRESQKHQDWATRFLTEAFRRDSRMNTFAIHLGIDAFPSGWMKTIMDCERRPKKAFFTYKDLLSPSIVSLRTDRQTYWAGETTEIEAWICNDSHETHAGARLAYQIEMNGKVIASGISRPTVPICSALYQGTISAPLPSSKTRTRATVKLSLVNKKGAAIHETSLALEVFPKATKTPPTAVHIVGKRKGKAARLVSDLGIEASWSETYDSNSSILIDDYDMFCDRRKQIGAAVRKGAKALFIEMPDGKIRIGNTSMSIGEMGFGERWFVSRNTGHHLVQDFEPEDFRLWYDSSSDRIEDLVWSGFDANDWDPILTSGKVNWGGPEASLAYVAAEKHDGRGTWQICQVKLSGRTKENPVADIFARRLLIECKG